MDEDIHRKECKGCRSLSISGEYSCNGLFNIDGICPCTNCLVKPTCRFECEDYGVFAHRIKEFRFEGHKDEEIVKKMEMISKTRQTFKRIY